MDGCYPTPPTRFPGQLTRAVLDSFSMFISLGETQSTLYRTVSRPMLGMSEETVGILANKAPKKSF